MSSVKKIRNVGIIAHIDAGKTTIAERFLYYSKKIHKIGEVHNKDTELDYTEQEKKHGITITSSSTSFDWNDNTIHFIDTPGHIDFTIEVERSLKILDGAIVVLDAVKGIESQTETIWKQAEKFNVSKIVFINKMDRVGADGNVVENIFNTFHKCSVPIQIPIGKEKDFIGVIDLIKMNASMFSDNIEEPPYETDIPVDYLGQSNEARKYMIEKLAEFDEEIMELYVNDMEISIQILKSALRRQTINNNIVPICYGSALHNCGIEKLLDAVVDYLPSPKEKIILDVDNKQYNSNKLLAYAFKVQMLEDRKIVYVRIYSGRIGVGDELFNVKQNLKEKVSRMFEMHADKKKRIETAGIGEIVAIAGLKNTKTGDTLTNGEEFILEDINKYPCVMSYAIEAKTICEKEKLLDCLEKFVNEDPTFSYKEDEMGQIIISGVGELHLQIAMERLEQQYNLKTKMGKPQVICRETVEGIGIGESVFEKSIELNIYGKAKVKIEPAVGIIFSTESINMDDVIVRNAVNNLKSAMCSVSGFPLHNVKISILSVEYNNFNPEVGTIIALNQAFKIALDNAGTILLEPLMSLNIFVATEFVGSVISDIVKRSGKIIKNEIRGKDNSVNAIVPLRNLYGYSSSIRSITKGKVNFDFQFLDFA